MCGNMCLDKNKLKIHPIGMANFKKQMEKANAASSHSSQMSMVQGPIHRAQQGPFQAKLLVYNTSIESNTEFP